MVDGSQVEKAKGRGPKGPGADCENCPLQNRPFVPASGPADATLFVIGEAPGEQEARQGRPFVGPSGRLLDHLFMMNGFRRADTAYMNTVNCHPLKNENPSKEAIAACSGYLDHEIKRRPVEKILAVGKFAAQEVLGSRGAITKLRVGPPRSSPRWPGVTVVPSVHPAACFRSGDYYPHLVSDVRKLTKPQARWIEPTYTVVDDVTSLSQALEHIDQFEGSPTDLYVDAEWAPDKTLLSIGIAWTPDRVLVVGRNALADSEARRLLGEFLSTRRLSAHFGRADIPVLRQLWPDLRLSGDSMLASYTLDERTRIHNLDWCAQEHLGAPEWKSVTEQYVGSPKNPDYSKIPLDILYKYNAWDTAAGFQLDQHFGTQIRDQGQWELPYQYTIRVSNMLMEVESGGLEIDMDNLEYLEYRYQGLLAALEGEFAGLEVNPRSPKQVKEFLTKHGITTASTDFEHLTDINNELTGKKRREASHAKYRISRKCTGELRDRALALVERMIAYRKHHKMSSTYVKGVRERLVGNKIYPWYCQVCTVTGRLSSNVQQFPRPGDEEGRAIRNLVRASPGNILVGADYSQGEFRIVAWRAGAKWAIEVCNDPERDVFWEFAHQFYGKELTLKEYRDRPESKAQRNEVKRVVHGTNYGGAASHLATYSGNLQETIRLQRFILVEKCPEIKRWQQETRHKVINLGEPVQTVYGRKRRFWSDTFKNKKTVKDVENECLAVEPQSTLSDIACEAACELTEQGYAVRILMHDAIYAEVPVEQQAEAEAHITKVMEEVAARRLPGISIPAEAHSATHWGDIA